MSDIEHLAAEVDAHPDYRVLRRIVSINIDAELDPSWRKAVILDTETTGLDTETCKIIEIGLKPIWYDDAGVVRRALPAQSWLHDPGEPLTPEITEITGLTDADLQGQVIPDAEIAAIADGALIIAHNAGFDRPICERRFPWASRLPWACSSTEIEWRKIGSNSASLTVIASHLGSFYDAHRANTDCEALVAILSKETPECLAVFGTFLNRLLSAARTPSARIWASAAPFESKDVLKSRGYRWHDGKIGRGKCWYRDMPVDQADHEIAWLKNSAITSHAVAQTLTARMRFSNRSFVT